MKALQSEKKSRVSGDTPVSDFGTMQQEAPEHVSRIHSDMAVTENKQSYLKPTYCRCFFKAVEQSYFPNVCFNDDAGSQVSKISWEGGLGGRGMFSLSCQSQ